MASMKAQLEQMDKMMYQMQQQRELLAQHIEIYDNSTNEYKYLAQLKKPEVYLWCPMYKYEVLEEMALKYKYIFMKTTKRFHLLTYTFCPSVVNTTCKNIWLQRERLRQVLRKYIDHKYIACFEQHTSGILHCHLIVCMDPIELKAHIMKHLILVTPSRKMFPAVTMKPINKTLDDLNKAYAYIYNNKKDHPIYKDLFINY